MKQLAIAVAVIGGLCFGLPAAEDTKEAPAKSSWTGSLSLSGTFVDGNSNSTNTRTGIEAERKLHDGSFEFSAEYNEASSEGKTSARNTTVGLKVNHDISEADYLFIGYEIYKDKFKNIDLRNKGIFGYGRKVIAEEKTRFNVEFGGAWVHESYIESSTATSKVEDNEYFALRLADKFSHVNESGMEFFQKGEYVPSTERSSDYSITSTQGVRTKLSTAWSMETSVKLVYINNVPRDKFGVKIPRSDGNDVSRLDTYYFIGLNRSF